MREDVLTSMERKFNNHCPYLGAYRNDSSVQTSLLSINIERCNFITFLNEKKIQDKPLFTCIRQRKGVILNINK